MSLIDDLRAAAGSVPPSHVPTVHELPGVLGALILHLEHSDFLDAADEGAQAVTDLISPPEPEPEPGPDQQAQIAQLQAQIAAMQGAQGHPTVEVSAPETSAPASSAPTAPDPPSSTEGPA